MDGGLPGDGARIEDLLMTVPITVAELREAVGHFEEDTAGMLRASIATAERAFAEVGACDAVIDKAAARGLEGAGRLRDLLGREARDEVVSELAALEEVAEEVRGASAALRLLHRILGREAAAEDGAPAAVVPRLDETGLPELPSAYGDEAEYDDLLAMADRGAELAPGLELAHRERLAVVAAHLVTLVRQAARTGFADEGFAEAALREARAAHALWLRCLEQRRRDVGR
ncbi:hypothetical protein ACGF5F_27095 [Streptomyces sp. NPDC047821]|uniref:hypothetical protein n=1 Tax=Streptomyces sp. NPDC047821 TaxID=3365488 RepID=UPI00371E263D